MQVLGIERVAGRAVVFGYVEGEEHAVEILHVGDIATDADDGCGVERAEALDVGKSRK